MEAMDLEQLAADYDKDSNGMINVPIGKDADNPDTNSDKDSNGMINIAIGG